MQAELAKLRYLPLPRWTAASLIAICVLFGVGVFIRPPSTSAGFTDLASSVLTIAFPLAATILGVWVATLEFAAGTLQRTLTAESSRATVLTSKLVVLVAAVIVLGAAAAAATGGLVFLAGEEHGVSIDSGESARALFGLLPIGVLGAVVGFGFGLLVRSMGGGLTLALAFTFILSGFFSFIPGVQDYMYAVVTQDLTNHLTGSGDTTNGIGVAVVGSLLWAVAIVLPGWLVFARGDLK